MKCVSSNYFFYVKNETGKMPQMQFDKCDKMGPTSQSSEM